MKNKILSLVFLAASLFSVNAQQEIIKRNFSAKGIENVNVRTDPGNIEINTWKKSEVLIKVFANGSFDEDDLIIEESNKTIKFQFEIEDNWNCNVNVIVYSPNNMNFKLETTGGNISIENNVKGNLDLETYGGHITFQDVKGRVLAKTRGGHITGKDVFNNVELHSDGGHITLNNINNGNADISTYGGHINVGNVKANLNASTHGGNIEINNVGGNADVLTYGGHISLKHVSGNASMETYGGNLYLLGATGKVKAVTMGGHIRLENITGSIKAVTNGGNIQAKLNPDRNSESSLETNAGNITILLPTKAETEIKVNIEGYGITLNSENLLKSDFTEKYIKVDEDDGELRAQYILNGGGSIIKLYSSHGKVKIHKWNK